VLWQIDKDEFTLNGLVGSARADGAPFSDSRIRTAVKELQDRGEIIDTGRTVRLASGRRARVLARRT
jgi:hypothetical protein